MPAPAPANPRRTSLPAAPDARTATPQPREPEFPIRLIPIVVPLLAVLLALVAYFILGEVL
jgi:hypothetical protein